MKPFRTRLAVAGLMTAVIMPGAEAAETQSTGVVGGGIVNAIMVSLLNVLLGSTSQPGATLPNTPDLDSQLSEALGDAGFTGKVQSTVERRLGRPLNSALADLGRLLWFDSITSLGNDNSCSGCHSPAFGFGDSQSIAIGVENNGIVGPGRTGPRNQRRTPMAINAGFFPRMMWNGRFSANSHDPFDTSEGVRVPFALGGTTVWRPDSAGYYGTAFDPAKLTTLLAVQAHFPPTELIEVAGFAVDDPENMDPRLYAPPHLVSSGLISDTVPIAIPGPNGNPTPTWLDPGFALATPKAVLTPGGDLPDSVDRGYSIRAKALYRLNTTPDWVAKFAAIYPEAAGGNITFAEVGAALAEFQYLSLIASDAPIDQYARGNLNALTDAQKRGALLFFGKANCVACHAVGGGSNEQFSDFQNHVAGIPQVAPKGFGLKPGGNPQNPDDFPGNFEFAGPNHDEDFGAEDLTGDPIDRYAFRTAPLRNVVVQPAFFHNGAFTRLRDAIEYHLNTLEAAPKYDPVAAGLAPDLTVHRGPIEPVLKRLDPRLAALSQHKLSPQEIDDLYEFVRGGLLDPNALPGNLCKMIPTAVPSGRPVLTFQGCS